MLIEDHVCPSPPSPDLETELVAEQGVFVGVATPSPDLEEDVPMEQDKFSLAQEVAVSRR